MRLIVLFFASLLLGGCVTTDKVALTSKALIGTWRCGPTVMHGPNFDISVTTETANASDGTYSTLTTSVITPHGKPSITTTDRAWGTWLLEDDVITSTVQRVEFLTSSDPSITKEIGQQAQDAQVRKKSTYQSRILEFTGHFSRSIPVNSMYKEAAVESSCERT